MRNLIYQLTRTALTALDYKRKNMKVLYLLNRLFLRIKANGLKDAIKDILYFNRVMVVIEKKIENQDIEKKEYDYVVIDDSNYQMIEKKYNTKIFKYYAERNVKTLLASKNNEWIGFIRWTQDDNFSDIKKIGLNINSDEVYMFDFWVKPEHRGTTIVNQITSEAYEHLKTLGIRKHYGYYFSDNIQALWWHRAVMKPKEIKKIKCHRLIFIEMVNGKIFV